MPLIVGVEVFDGGHELTFSFFSADARGADAVAVGDGRETLDMGAEHAADRLGLGLAQLRELVGDVGDRAVLLAQLLPHAVLTGKGQRAHRRGVALVGEDQRQHLGRRGLGVRGGDLGELLLDEGRPPLRERLDGIGAGGLGEEADRLDWRGRRTARRSRRARARSARTPWPGDLGRGGPRTGVASLDRALLDEVVEVTAYGGRGQVETLSERGCGGGPVDQDRPRDALPRRLIAFLVSRVHVFHNTSVTLLLPRPSSKATLSVGRGSRS